MSRDYCYDYALMVVIAMVAIAMVAIAISAMVVVAISATMIIPVIVVSSIMVITMLLLVAWSVFVVVPVVLHKIDPLVARVVFSAVLGPMLAMARGYVQIYWLALVTFLYDYSGLTIVDLRLRKAADVESAIKAGLADADRNPDLSECRGGDGSSGYCRCD